MRLSWPPPQARGAVNAAASRVAASIAIGERLRQRDSVMFLLSSQRSWEGDVTRTPAGIPSAEITFSVLSAAYSSSTSSEDTGLAAFLVKCPSTVEADDMDAPDTAGWDRLVEGPALRQVYLSPHCVLVVHHPCAVAQRRQVEDRVEIPAHLLGRGVV